MTVYLNKWRFVVYRYFTPFAKGPFHAQIYRALYPAARFFRAYYRGAHYVWRPRTIRGAKRRRIWRGRRSGRVSDGG